MKNICGISLKGALVTSALVALLVMPLATLTQADDTQKPTTVSWKKHPTAQELMVNKRIAAGFSVIGPLEVMEASTSALKVDDSPNNSKTISLQNKKVTVLDESGNGASMSSVTKDRAIIICQKKDEVVIYLVKGYKKGTEHGK
jgi:hypothetical protein